MHDSQDTSARGFNDEHTLPMPLDGLSWLYQDETLPSPTNCPANDARHPDGVNITNAGALQSSSVSPACHAGATHEREPSLDGHDAFEEPSGSSLGSIESFTSTSPASRQRFRNRGSLRRKAHPDSLDKRRYQCTFCTDAFKTKHDWQRHEASKHLSLEQWKCNRLGPFKEMDGRLCCVFCGRPDPTADHLEGHNYLACLRQPDEARTFCRKDHLRQHLRLFHGDCFLMTDMDDWRSSIELVRSRCGFCNAQIQSWTGRQRHLAEHFRNGADMVDWKGDRGLDAHVERLVENDMPAFLIGQSRRRMRSISATRTRLESDASVLNISPTYDHSSTDPGGLEDLDTETGHSPTMQTYQHIESMLLQYVSEQIAEGHVATDQELQSEICQLIRGPGSTWNRGWPDDVQWLEVFKKKAGLTSLPLSGGRNAFIGTDVL